jgi:hypothetical protein
MVILDLFSVTFSILVFIQHFESLCYFSAYISSYRSGRRISSHLIPLLFVVHFQAYTLDSTGFLPANAQFGHLGDRIY